VAEEQKKYPVQMTRKGVLVSGALIFFIMGWMFILGILVGRGTAPVPVKTHALEKQLDDLKTAMRNQERVDAEAKAGQDKPRTTDLGFYEALKKPPAKARYKAGTPPTAAKKPAERAAASRREKKTAVEVPGSVKPKAEPVAKKDKAVSLAAKAEHAAAQASPPPAQKGRFTIQVAAFKDSKSAEQMVAKLRGRHYPGYFLRVDIHGKGAWFRVRVGAFESRTAAEDMLKRLKNDRFKGIVIGTQQS
jgi:cell division septation protein DedD